MVVLLAVGAVVQAQTPITDWEEVFATFYGVTSIALSVCKNNRVQQTICRRNHYGRPLPTMLHLWLLFRTNMINASLLLLRGHACQLSISVTTC